MPLMRCNINNRDMGEERGNLFGAFAEREEEIIKKGADGDDGDDGPSTLDLDVSAWTADGDFENEFSDNRSNPAAAPSAMLLIAQALSRVSACEVKLDRLARLCAESNAAILKRQANAEAQALHRIEEHFSRLRAAVRGEARNACNSGENVKHLYRMQDMEEKCKALEKLSDLRFLKMQQRINALEKSQSMASHESDIGTRIQEMIAAKAELAEAEAAVQTARIIEATTAQFDQVAAKLSRRLDGLETLMGERRAVLANAEKRIEANEISIADAISDATAMRARLKELQESVSRDAEQSKAHRERLDGAVAAFSKKERETFAVATRCDTKIGVLEDFLKDRRRRHRSKVSSPPSGARTPTRFLLGSTAHSSFFTPGVLSQSPDSVSSRGGKASPLFFSKNDSQASALISQISSMVGAGKSHASLRS